MLDSQCSLTSKKRDAQFTNIMLFQIRDEQSSWFTGRREAQNVSSEWNAQKPNFPRSHQDCGGQAKPSEIYNLNYDMV